MGFLKTFLFAILMPTFVRDGYLAAINDSDESHSKNLCTISTDVDISVSNNSSGTSNRDVELSKMHAVKRAIQERAFQGKLIIGIGSGSTVVYATKFIAECIKTAKENAKKEGRQSDLDVICIPSSFQARQLILENNLTLGSLDNFPQIDWTIDGADEIDLESNLIKGGGGCLTQEKILASASEKLYIVADFSKASSKLGTVWKKGIPVEVVPSSHLIVKKTIEKKFGGEAALRMAIAKAGPVVTDNGNFILDWKFSDNITDWKKIEVDITMIPGVIEVGLFLGMANKVYIGSPDGKVEILAHKED